jgi:hypothetical protein
MSRKGNLTTISTLDLEDELENLCGELDNPNVNKEEVEAQIKEFCDRLYPDPQATLLCPDGKLRTGGERFYFLFAKRWRSSGDYIDYVIERDRVFVRIAETSARKHRENLKDLNRKRWNKNSRDMQMAREFLRLKSTSDVSDTKLKWRIGRRHNLGRSASNDAINKGLQLLDGSCASTGKATKVASPKAAR